ncbi:4Fe-4S cluster-binding domain-containing protein, partial [Arthrospira platensis SPKY2]
QDFMEMLDLLRTIKTQVNKPVWMWTGYRLEELGSYQKQMLEDFVDVLVDGKFEKDKKDITLKYCGSTNQRVINIKETFRRKDIVLYED